MASVNAVEIADRHYRRGIGSRSASGSRIICITPRELIAAIGVVSRSPCLASSIWLSPPPGYPDGH